MRSTGYPSAGIPSPKQQAASQRTPIRQRRKEASMRSMAQFAAQKRADALAASKRARQAARSQRPTLSYEERFYVRQKAKAAQRVSEAMKQRGGPAPSTQFTPISVEEARDAYGAPLAGYGGMVDEEQTHSHDNGAPPPTWWQSQPNWLKLALLGGGAFGIYQVWLKK